ncbi:MULTISPECIES: CsbD family protein [Streptomyces]|uniref:CsbD family protein n=1 Tax=Streptomyces nondiastaticus TaxID=3154512 RepID=A0ABW6U2I3_9ACTN|nr:CsbD family protein [Streptomyces sp. VNUA116]WKU43034.1 CsbD family protein [Streptomyces sp. VNUA116]
MSAGKMTERIAAKFKGKAKEAAGTATDHDAERARAEAERAKADAKLAGVHARNALRQ